MRAKTNARTRGTSEKSRAGIAWVQSDKKATPAFWRKMFKELSKETEPKIAPGVEQEIESDTGGSGGNAFARRVGLAFLTLKFSESASTMGEDMEGAMLMADMADRVKASVEAHREVARLLEMAHSRMLTALSPVAERATHSGTRT